MTELGGVASADACGSCRVEFGALLGLPFAALPGCFDLLLYAAVDGCEGRGDELGTVGAAHGRLHVLGGG
ncbi:hypothetical protein [Streptomyces sp. NPDC049744]|uniref:hypothetical protein n=1 Tax=Streptomyces sp. NPDC049744 TaxID=3154359 RepID=UPI003426F3F2